MHREGKKLDIKRKRRHWKGTKEISYYFQMKLTGGNRKRSSTALFCVKAIQSICYTEQSANMKNTFRGLDMRLALTVIVSIREEIALAPSESMRIWNRRS